MSEVSLLVETILHLLDPLAELVSEHVKGVFEVRDTLCEGIEFFLTDTTSRSLGNLEVGHHLLKLEELLLEGSDSCLQILEVFGSKGLELSSQAFKLISQILGYIIDSLGQHFLYITSFLIGIALKLDAKCCQVISGLCRERGQVISDLTQLGFDQIDLLENGISIQVT